MNAEGAHEAMPATRSFLDAAVARHEADLVAFRRRLHMFPELSGAEVVTTDEVIDRLSLAGLDPKRLKRGTGLVCDVGEGGPVVIVRADLDALAMSDEKPVPYQSRVEGVAHACGHDVHTTIVMGVGLVLQDLWPQLRTPGTVRLVFEPAEESIPGGAPDVIDEGWCRGVGSALGVHCDPKTDLGRIGLRVGPITSASDLVEIEFIGPGGHTARPELTVDTVRWAARVATDLPELVAEATDGQLSVVFGAINGGDAPNVIPTRVSLRGTARTPDADTWDRATDVVSSALATLTVGADVGTRLVHVRGVPPVVNDAAVVESVRAATAAVGGPGMEIEAAHSRGGDSFAWFGREVPSAYFRLGTHDPASPGPRLDIHSGTFDVDERCVALGVKVLVESARRELDRLSAVESAVSGVTAPV